MAAAHGAAATVEESLLELEMRANIAEQAAAVEHAEDRDEFLRALIDELHGWDVYIERLQVKVATTAGDCRNQGEGAIRELRRRRNTLSVHLGEMASASDDAWREAREHVKAARNELASRTAEMEAALQRGRRGDAHRHIA